MFHNPHRKHVSGKCPVCRERDAKFPYGVCKICEQKIKDGISLDKHKGLDIPSKGIGDTYKKPMTHD